MFVLMQCKWRNKSTAKLIIHKMYSGQNAPALVKYTFRNFKTMSKFEQIVTGYLAEAKKGRPVKQCQEHLVGILPCKV
jgi:hypothetical protein